MLSKQIKLESELYDNFIKCTCVISNTKGECQELMLQNALFNNEYVNEEYTQFIINDLIDNILSEIIRSICKLSYEHMFGVKGDPVYEQIFEITYNNGYIPQKDKVIDLYFEPNSITNLRNLLIEYYKK